MNRYEATRRRHPLAPADRVVEGIRKERLMMESLRGDADLIIDTTGLTPHELRDRIRDAFAEAPPEQGLQVSIISFGFKYGAPRDADLVLDVRFLPNPHWVDELRPLPGTDDRVRDYVQGQDQYREFMARLESLLDVVVPGYVAEGKSYLTSRSGARAAGIARSSSPRSSGATSRARHPGLRGPSRPSTGLSRPTRPSRTGRCRAGLTRMVADPAERRQLR